MWHKQYEYSYWLAVRASGICSRVRAIFIVYGIVVRSLPYIWVGAYRGARSWILIRTNHPNANCATHLTLPLHYRWDRSPGSVVPGGCFGSKRVVDWTGALLGTDDPCPLMGLIAVSTSGRFMFHFRSRYARRIMRHP